MEACEALGLSHHLLVNAASYVNHDGTPAACADSPADPAIQKSDGPGIQRAAANPPPPPPPPPPAPSPLTNSGITTIAPMKGRLGGYGRALMQNIVPITDTTPACFGVCCSLHKQCARYHAVDGMADSSHAIDSCEDGVSRPLFVLHQVEAVAQ